jgi:hypothetical protein
MFTSGIGEPQSTPYRVMARDAASTVVEWFDETAGSNRLTQINFEDNRYWVSMGRFREWFRRVG